MKDREVLKEGNMESSNAGAPFFQSVRCLGGAVVPMHCMSDKPTEDIERGRSGPKKVGRETAIGQADQLQRVIFDGRRKKKASPEEPLNT